MMKEAQQSTVVLLSRRNAQPEGHVRDLIERRLAESGCQVFVDREQEVGVGWAQEIEAQIRSADAVVAILTDSSSESEMLQFEVETALDEWRNHGKPFLLPVRIELKAPLGGSMGASLDDLQFVSWHGPSDDARVADEVRSALKNSMAAVEKNHPLEPAGGAMSPDSPFYIVRDADVEVENAIRARESVILVRGPRQIGKTSLIGRGTKFVKGLGCRQASTDFQMVSSAQLSDPDLFARMLAATLAKQFSFKYDFAEEWQDVFGPNLNLANFMRALIAESDQPIVWFMDEADRLFHASFASDFFGLLRSWHNARATDPSGPWGRFTLVIAYATEARLFIRDLNQSPFNVGRQVTMANFTVDQTAQLNELYGNPVKRRSDLEALHFLLAGQPFLVRRAFEQLASGAIDFATLFETADRSDGPFGDHLRRLLVAVSQFPEMVSALRSSLDSTPPAGSDAVQRLVAAGVLREDPAGRAVPACDLYALYLDEHISEPMR